MTDEFKNVPAWMRGKPNQEPQKPQEEDAPPPTDEDLPPWLREQAPKVKRVAPPQPSDQPGVPPWLAGLEEPKSYKVGGTELSEEYLSAGDQLPESLDTELTYDSWMEQQIESNRIKDIEEEIPDLLATISDEPVSDEPTTPKVTGQLPDWFLGLEELDTTDAPDWFVNQEKPASNEPPPWINDMNEAETPKPQPETPDEIGSFFSSLGGLTSGEESELPDLDWSNQQANQPEAESASDEFFAQFTDSPAPAARASVEPDEQQIAEEVAHDFPDEAAPVKIPQNELDAFFDNLAADRASSLDDIEEPDLEWFVSQEPAAEPEEEAPPEPEATPTAQNNQETLTWLNELQGIVSSVSRPKEREELPGQFDTGDSWAPASDQDSAGADSFQWPSRSVEDEDAASATDTQESDWLTSISAQQSDEIPEESPEQAAPSASTSPSMLSGIFNPRPPEPEPEPAEEEMTAGLSAEDAGLIPEEELNTGWLTDDLFEQEPQAAAEPVSADDFLSALRSETPTGQDDEEFTAFGTSDAEQPELDEAFAQDDYFAALGTDNQEASALPQADDFYAALGTETPEQAEPEEAPQIDDFFASLGEEDQEEPTREQKLLSKMDDFYASVADEDAQNEGEPDAQAVSPQSNQDFFAALGIGRDEQADQPEDFFDALGIENRELPEPQKSTSYSDDFYSLLNTGGEDEPQAEPEETPEDFFASLGGQAEDQQAEEPDETPLPEDFFASLGTPSEDEQEAEPQDDFYSLLGVERGDAQDDSEEMPLPEDFFASLDAQTDDQQEQEAVPQGDNFFASLGTGDDQQPEAETAFPSADDFFASLGDASMEQPQATSEPDDFFAAFSEPQNTRVELPPEEDFFEALGMIGTEQPEEASGQWDAQEQPPEEDFFQALGMIDDQDQPEQAASPAQFSDVDSYLASLSANQPEVQPDSSRMFNPDENVDIDALFGEPVMRDRDMPATPAPSDVTPSINEAWLAELQASVGEVSASAIVRQQSDRPVDELPDRLKRLRQRAEQIPAETGEAASDSLSDSLTDVAAAPFVSGTSSLTGSLALTPEQQVNVKLLRAIIPTRQTAQTFHLSAIEATYDSPFMSDLEDSAETVVGPARPAEEPRARPRPRRRTRRLSIRVDRFLVAVVLATAVILPFVVPALRIGSLPPSGFVVGSAAQRAYDAVDAVQPGSLVLIGIEYGPTATGELDAMTNDLLRHVLMRAAYPVLIGGDPVGLLHASDLIGSISGDAAFLQRIGARQPLAANTDYYVVRYLPGSVIGLRAFSADTANLLLSDIGGQATDLRVRSLREFALVVVITDRAESLRAYAEQIAPLTQAPLVAAVSYSAAPLVEPYTSALGAGLLVGYGDSYTYNGLLDNVQARGISQRIRIIPTDTPAPTPTTPPPTPRPQIAATVVPTARPTIPPTTPPPTATPKPLGSATVNAAQPVNMRGGPGTNNPVLASVPPGTRMTVLGFNDDQSWVNVRLDDGQEGWISASLLRLEAPQSSLIHARQVIDGGPTRTPRPTLPPPTFAVPGATPAAPTAASTEASGVAASTESATPVPAITRRPPTATPSATLRPSATRQATPTAQATEAVTEAVAVSVPSAPLPPSPGYRDERWYAMNLGIIASALIISLGAVVNVLRDLLRRGRRR